MIRHSVLFATLMLFLTAPAVAAYRSGRELCGDRVRPTSNEKNEYGFFVRSGQTEIYAWTRKPFSVSKKTVVFVNGGPGDHAHDSALQLSQWNVVFFDQRGIACSRPSSETLFLDRRFYSSQNAVQDIEAIRQFLKLRKISLYGVSYGTVPAHLYAATFPAFTRAVVLEGVVADSSPEVLIANPARRELLQNFFLGLPMEWQDRILELSLRGDLSPFWFSQVGKMMFYLDHGSKAFTQFLEAVLFKPGAAESLLPGFSDRVPEDTELGFSGTAMRMLSCHEMGMNTEGTSFDFVFSG